MTPRIDFRPFGEPARGDALPIQTSLVSEFPAVHPDARFALDFMRTLRIPDDGRDWPLPAGLGRFSMAQVTDLGPGAPRRWREDGGVVLPMYQAEAMWMRFSSRPGLGSGGAGPYGQSGYPFAVKVLAGGIDAVSGEDWQRGLVADPQNYLVVPTQPWLDGFCVAKGRIRQFVAARLGEGETVEERLTGQARTGGLQIVVTPMKAEVWERMKQESRPEPADEGLFMCESRGTYEMGLAAGGSMRQEIYGDPHGLDVWDQDHTRSCFVRIVQAQAWHDLTGHPVPHPPVTKERYLSAGIPWFGYFDADQDVLHAQPRLKQLDGGAPA